MKKFRKISKFIVALPILLGVLSLTSCDKKDKEDHLRSYHLCEEMNDFIRESQLNGTFAELNDIWFSGDESKKVIDRNLSGENGKITFASCLQSEPMGYIKDNQEAGFSTDLVYRFAKAKGYSLEFYNSENTNTSIAAVLSGRADFGGTYASITEERRNNVCFSDPYYDNKIMVMVSNDTAATITSLEDLNGSTWGCCEGSTYNQYISEKMTKSAGKINEYPTELEALNELSHGRVDAIILDKPVSDYVVATNKFPNLCQYDQFFGYQDQYAFFFPKFAEQSLSYYANKKIATVTGSVDEQFIKNKLPNAEICYYENLVDCSAALAANKVDAYADETPSFIYNKENNPTNLHRVPENLGDSYYGFLFPRNSQGETNCASFNFFLSTLRASGKLAQLVDKWIYNYETAEPEINYESLEGDETLRIQTTGVYPPFNFLKGDKITGLEVEIATLYAQSVHKKISLTLNNFSGILSSAESVCDFDIAFTLLTHTPERGEKFYFSDSYYDFDIFLVTSVGAAKLSLFERIAESFESTFVKEQRWKLLFSGLFRTLEITLLSIVFGSILGLGVFLLMNRVKPSKKVFKVLDYIVNGMPVVVLLMIVYYVIFGKSNLSGIGIAVGVFTVLFTSSFARSLSVSVDAVNKNQVESALALGYRYPQALFRFVLPQAMPSFLELFKNDIVTLLKGTAIVGYIAIQDLTKATDIIRSRTYEAIFPLLTLALIYFLLAFILVILVKSIQVGTNPKRRKASKILKGVKTDENRS